jgi:threonine dehydrogenase-like Zn-dependent dehydrogenase
MRQMMLIGAGEVRWDETDEPTLSGPGQAIVRPLAVATCDLDTGVLRGTFPLEGPYPFGHEGIAEVVAVGDDVTTVGVGDRVVVPFQISCGTCRPCLAGRTGNCASQPPMSTFGLGAMGGLGWGGLLADLALVPYADAMLVKVPDAVDPAAIASASDNLPDAWRTVGPHLDPADPQEVLVVGGDTGPASIGLYAAGIARALGSPRVVYSDTDPDRLALATRLGVEVLEGPPPRKLGSFGISVDASGTEDGIRCALNSTAFDGVCSSSAVYLEDPRMPLFSMYSRCCTFHIGRAHVRPAIPEVLALVEQGFDPSLVTTTHATWDDAVEALEEPGIKVVLSR